MKPLAKTLFIALFSVCAALFLFALGVNLYMLAFARPYIYRDVSELPESYTVIVPGAKVYDTTVSFVVRDRIDVALSVVNAGKARRVLVSGDHGRKNYDEVNRIKSFMLQNYRVDESIIFLDHAGFSTYETMYRADAIFCVTDAVVVTQKFHCVRAVYIGRKLGLNVVALEAPELTGFSRSTHLNWEVREFLARVKSFFLVLFRAKPTYLGAQIPITGDASLSWD